MAGSSKPAKMAMMAMTVSSSINVKAAVVRRDAGNNLFSIASP
jgi:hypothetical protein